MHDESANECICRCWLIRQLPVTAFLQAPMRTDKKYGYFLTACLHFCVNRLILLRSIPLLPATQNLCRRDSVDDSTRQVRLDSQRGGSIKLIVRWSGLDYMQSRLPITKQLSKRKFNWPFDSAELIDLSEIDLIIVVFIKNCAISFSPIVFKCYIYIYIHI